MCTFKQPRCSCQRRAGEEEDPAEPAIAQDGKHVLVVIDKAVVEGEQRRRPVEAAAPDNAARSNVGPSMTSNRDCSQSSCATNPATDSALMPGNGVRSTSRT